MQSERVLSWPVSRACGEVLLVFQPILHTDIEVALLFTEGEVFPTVHRESKHARLLFKNESRAVALLDAKDSKSTEEKKFCLSVGTQTNMSRNIKSSRDYLMHV